MPLSSVLGAQSLVRPGVCTSSTRPASPFDGQVIYETDTDKVLAWDGSQWELIGPVASPISAAGADFLATSQTTTSTSYTDLATAGPSVTLTTGTSAIVSVSCIASNNQANANAESGVTYMGFAVSGASTVTAADARAGFGPQIHTSHSQNRSGTFLVTGLTAGSNTFTAKYRVGGALATGTGTFSNRHITVLAL